MATNQAGPTGPGAAQGATSAEDGDVGSVDSACNTGTGSDTKHGNTGEGTISSTADDLGKGEVDKQNIGCQSDKGFEDEIQADKTDGNEENRVPSQDKAELGAMAKDATKDAYKKDIKTGGVDNATAGRRPDKEIDESKMGVDVIPKPGHAKDQSTENIHSDSNENCTDKTEKNTDVNDGEMTLDHKNGNKLEMKTDVNSEIREGRTTHVENGKADKVLDPLDSAAKGKDNNKNLQDNPTSVGKPSTSPENLENVDLNAEKRNEGDTEVKSITHLGNSDEEVGIKDEIEHPFVDESKDANKKSPPGDALNNKEASKSKVFHDQDLGTGNFEDEEKRGSEEKGESVSSQGNKKLDTANPKVNTSDQMRVKNGKISSNSSAEKESNVKHEKRTLEDTMSGDNLNKENEKSKDAGDVVTSQDNTRELSAERVSSESVEDFGGKLEEKMGRNNMDDGKKTPPDQINRSKPDIVVQSDGREDRTTEKESERTEVTPSLNSSNSVTNDKENSENQQDKSNVNEESFASPEIKEKVENKDPRLTSTNGTEKVGDENQEKKEVSDHGDRGHELDNRNDSNDTAAGFSGYETAAKDKDSTERDVPDDSKKDKVDGKGLKNADLVTESLQDEVEKSGEINNDDQGQGSKELESTNHQVSSAELIKEENDKRRQKTTAEIISSTVKRLAEKEKINITGRPQENSVVGGNSSGAPESLDEDIENAGNRELLERKSSAESGTPGEIREKPAETIVEVRSDASCTAEKKLSSKIHEQELEGKNISQESNGKENNKDNTDDTKAPNFPVFDQRNIENTLGLHVQNLLDTSIHEDDTHAAKKVTAENRNGEELNTKGRGKEVTCGGAEGILSSGNVAENEKNKRIENLDAANSPIFPEDPNRGTTKMESPKLQAIPLGGHNLICSNESNNEGGRKDVSEENVIESTRGEDKYTDSPQKQMLSATASSSMPSRSGQQTILREHEESTTRSENIKWYSEIHPMQSLTKYSMVQTRSTGENEDQESSDDERQNHNKSIREVHPDTKHENSKYMMDQQLGFEEGESEIPRNLKFSDIALHVQSSGRIQEYEDQIDLLLNEIVSDETVDKNREEWKKNSKSKLLNLFNRVIKEVTEGTSGLTSEYQEVSDIGIDNGTSSNDRSGGRDKNVDTAITTQPQPTPDVPGSLGPQDFSKSTRQSKKANQTLPEAIKSIDEENVPAQTCQKQKPSPPLLATSCPGNFWRSIFRGGNTAAKREFKLQLYSEECEDMHPLVIECCAQDNIKLSFIFSESEFSNYISYMQNIECDMRFPSASPCVMLKFSTKISEKIDDLVNVLMKLLKLVIAIPVQIFSPKGTDRSRTIRLDEIRKETEKQCKELKVTYNEIDKMSWIVGKVEFEEKATECMKIFKTKTWVETGRSEAGEEGIEDDFFTLKPFELSSVQHFDVVKSAEKKFKINPKHIYLDASSSQIKVKIEKEKHEPLKKFLTEKLKGIKNSKRTISWSDIYDPSLLDRIIPQMEKKLKFKLLHQVKGNDLVLYAENSEDSKTAKDCWQEVFAERSIPTAETLLDRQTIETALQFWEKDSKYTIKFHVTDDSVTVYGLKEDVDEVIHTFNETLKKKASAVDKDVEEQNTENEGNSLISEETYTVTLNLEDSNDVSLKTIKTSAKDIAIKYDCDVSFKKLKPIPKVEETVVGCTWTFGHESEKVIRMNLEDPSVANFNEVLVQWKTDDSRGRGMTKSNSGHEYEIVLKISKWQEGNAKEKSLVRRQIRYLFRQMRKFGVYSVSIPLNIPKHLEWPVLKLLKQFLCEKHMFTKCVTFCHPDSANFCKLRDFLKEFFEEEKIDECQKEFKIELMLGQLIDAKVEVLVNTTSKDLSQGAISNSILKAAGNEVQQEIDDFHPSQFKAGEVFTTDAYNLETRGIELICHGILQKWNGHGANIGMLKHFVSNCLRIASEYRMKSIAFPSIGTGKLGYPCDMVARAMFETVYNYMECMELSTLERIVFVVYDKDQIAIKAFKEAEKKHSTVLHQRGSLPSSVFPNPHNDMILEVTCSQIWNHDVDSVVVLWHSSEIFDMKLRKDFMKECGEDVERTWYTATNRQALQTKPEFIINLNTQNVLPFPYIFNAMLNERDIQKTLRSCILSADSLALSSVAIIVSAKDGVGRVLNQISSELYTISQENITIYTNLRKILLVVDEKLKAVTEKELQKLQNENQNIGHREKNRLQVAFKGNSGISASKAKEELIGRFETQPSQASRGSVEKEQKYEKPPESTATAEEKDTTQDDKEEHEKDHKNQHKGDHQETDNHSFNREKDAVGAPILLQRTENEKRSLIITFEEISQKNLSKAEVCSRIQREMQSEVQYTVVYPFLTKEEALLKFESYEDVLHFKEKFKSNTMKYRELPAQAVTNTKATLTKIVEKKLKENGWGSSDISEYSGVFINDSNNNIVLEGCLLEIQAARDFIKNAMCERKQKTIQTGSKDSSHNTEFQNENNRPEPMEVDEASDNGLTFQNNHYANQELSKQEVSDTTAQSSAIYKEQFHVPREDFELLEFFGLEKGPGYKKKTDKEVIISGRAADAEYYKNELKKVKKAEIPMEGKNISKDNKDFFRQTFPHVHMRYEKNKVVLHSTNKDMLDLCQTSLAESLATSAKAPNPPSKNTRSRSSRQYPELTVTVDDHSRSCKLGRPIKTFGNVHVFLRSDNILEVSDIECLVVPTDEYCQFKGKLASSLLQRGGNEIQTECLKNKKLFQRVGDCIKTKGGLLQFTSILHVIIKHWKSYIGKKEQAEEALADMKKAVNNCLKKTRDCGHKSVALPALGTGMSEIPHILCTTAYVQAVEEFAATKCKEKFEVHFFSMDDKIAGLIQMSFLTPLPWVRIWPLDDDAEYTFKIPNNLEVNIRYGDVLNLPVNGLMVRDDANLSMSGAFAKKVLKTTYFNYKQTREKAKAKNIAHGEVVPLQYSGNQSWKSIYHIILPQSHPTFVQLYQTCISGTLEIAEEDSHKTESIGMKMFSGKNRESFRDIADAIVEAITSHARTRQRYYLKKIYIWNEEKERCTAVVDAFKRYIAKETNNDSYLMKQCFVLPLKNQKKETEIWR